MTLDAPIISYPASAGGLLTRVLEAGKGAEVVLFIHGAGARADRWQRNLSAIASVGYRCLAVDLPGHGFAYKGQGFKHSAAGYADFIESFLKEQGIRKAHFVGTSLGALVLSTVACRNPSLLRSLSLVGAVGMFPLGAQLRALIARKLVDTTLEGIQAKLRLVVLDSSTISDDFVQEEWRINNSPGAAQSFALLADYFRDRLDEDVVAEKMAATTARHRRLVIWGMEDPSAPPASGRQLAQLLGVAFVGIPRTAHAPYWEAPEEFNRVLTEFLREAVSDAPAITLP